MKYINYYIFILCLAFSLGSCKIDEIPNPNGANVNDFLADASTVELQNLVTGIESLLRNDIVFYYDVTAIIGREYWYFTGSDPRYTGEVLGKGDSQLDNAGFYGTRPYAGRYKTVKNANILIDAVANTSKVTEAEANGYLGFAKTFQAYEMSIALMLQYNNGIRLDVSDPDKLGDFVGYGDALAGILSLLDEAYTHLQGAGDSFSFTLSSAMADFSNPVSFGEFNRGLSARIALYTGDNADVIRRLADSFMDMMGDFDLGPARFYSTAGGDQVNSIFRVRNQADGIIAHPTFLADIMDGDARAGKVVLRNDPLTLDGLTGTHDVFIYQSLNDFVPFMRNEELILIAAEANIGSDNTVAEAALNAIRGAHGLAPLEPGMSDEELVTELIYQRRYSLFGEGHRWVDMRRWDMLDLLPIDRVDDDVWVQFPRPVSEG